MPSRRVLQGLVLCAEDLEASKDSVHIAGYDPIAGDPSVGETPLYCDHPAPDEANIVTRGHAKTIYNVISVGQGCFARSDDPNAF